MVYFTCWLDLCFYCNGVLLSLHLLVYYLNKPMVSIMFSFDAGIVVTLSTSDKNNSRMSGLKLLKRFLQYPMETPRHVEVTKY